MLRETGGGGEKGRYGPTSFYTCMRLSKNKF